ncbi:repeat-containing protein D [Orientia tsutsugamushi]|nr:repeat-containing protein D [Orientia tsutsugamushi]
MLLQCNRLNIYVLKKTLKVLTLNINILKVLYDLDIPFSTFCSKLHYVGSNAPDFLAKIFKILNEMIKVHKND